MIYVARRFAGYSIDLLILHLESFILIKEMENKYLLEY